MADCKFIVAQKTQFVLDRVKKFLQTGENDGYWYFWCNKNFRKRRKCLLLAFACFPTMFSNAYILMDERPAWNVKIISTGYSTLSHTILTLNDTEQVAF